MATVTLGSRAQIVLPAEIRKKLGLYPGDRLIIEAEKDHVVIRKAPVSDFQALEAFASPLWRGYAKELQLARDEWDK
ncbi:MAG TPA: AbrB/MazE/SpoVT family DNA-binding domain-containing protein [Candidatus Competibacteraceae bacterium]|nr:AbrB/MazE/SpoVT family DNA-binding domain-containing protein [Candidatus Competibacteraceae bacterium]